MWGIAAVIVVGLSLSSWALVGGHGILGVFGFVATSAVTIWWEGRKS